jgi:predicted RNA-binding protein with PIN domain
MHYFIDGYNLLFRIAEKKQSLETMRIDLVRFLSRFSLDLTVVFDGSSDHRLETTRGHIGDLEIVYTSEYQSADAYIIQTLILAPHPRHHTVVTSDTSLARQCSQIGSHTITIEAFIAQLGKRKKKSKPAEPKGSEDSPSHIARLLKIFEERFKDL